MTITLKDLPERKKTSRFFQRIDRFERRLILKALKKAEGNRAHAARLLGLLRTTLMMKMSNLGITYPTQAEILEAKAFGDSMARGVAI